MKRSVAHFLAIALIMGCSGTPPTNPPTTAANPAAADPHILKTARLYARFLTDRGHGPNSAEEFTNYLRGLSPEALAEVGLVPPEDLAELLVSPRDGRPYVIVYGVTCQGGAPNRGQVRVLGFEIQDRATAAGGPRYDNVLPYRG
jgi:hypothetical protein